MQTHLVCSRRSFKTEMYFCEMTQTDCSTSLQENASCDNMSFFFVNPFMALQSSMVYKFGEPAYMLKNIVSSSCSISFPSSVIGSTIVKRLSIGFFTSPIHLLFLYGLFHFIVGQSMTILKKNFVLKFK